MDILYSYIKAYPKNLIITLESLEQKSLRERRN